MGLENTFGKTSISVDEARTLITSGLPTISSERVQLDDAFGRTSANDVHSLVTSPPADVSSMDGYAVRVQDVPLPGIELRLVGASKAGLNVVPTLEPSTCMRIFTGAPIPINADAVVIQEDVSAEADIIHFRAAATPGANIRKAGLNFQKGRRVLEGGRVITARDIGILAASGHNSVEVRRKPRIAVLSTGDELAEGHGGDLSIFDANRPALSALVRAFGGTPVDLGIARDDDASIASSLTGLDADMLVISGGASVGDHDRVRPLLQSLGLQFSFWKIRMRPGKPLLFGQLGDTPILGLPGNPVSAVVCSMLFLQPAIAAMLGGEVSGPTFENAVLSAPIGKTGERDDYLRATCTFRDGELLIEAHKQQDSSMLAVLAESNALLFRAAGAPPADTGDVVQVVRFDTIPGF